MMEMISVTAKVFLEEAIGVGAVFAVIYTYWHLVPAKKRK